jgi:hypothetical protein
MSPEARIEELRARLQLAQGTPTLLLAIVDGEASLGEARHLLIAILSKDPGGAEGQPLQVMDLGACDLNIGPARWVELTRSRPADAYVLTGAYQGPLAAPAFAGILNAEREFLRQLASGRSG